MLRIARITFCTLVLPGASFLRAQQLPSPKIDVAVTFNAERSLSSATPNTFWMQGGSIELGTNTWRGLGIAANISGTHASAIGATTIPLSLVTATFGPRYRWHADHRVSIYCEGLIGEADGFKSLFPSITAAQTSANSFASRPAAASTTGSPAISPSAPLRRRGNTRNFQMGPTMSKTISAWGPGFFEIWRLERDQS